MSQVELGKGVGSTVNIHDRDIHNCHPERCAFNNESQGIKCHRYGDDAVINFYHGYTHAVVAEVTAQAACVTPPSKRSK